MEMDLQLRPRSQLNMKNRKLKLMSKRTTPSGASRMLQVWSFFGNSQAPIRLQQAATYTGV